MSKKPIILSGSISIDRIMNFHGRYKDLIQPDKIHVLSVSILIDALKDSYGGTAANIAYSMALLGETPILLGSIGKNDQTYLKKLKADGVETRFVHQSDIATATYTVLTDSDDNQVGGFYPGAMSDSDSLTLEPWYGKNPLVVISANDPATMSRLVAECHEYNLAYCYDVGQQVTNISEQAVKEGISKCQILFVNDYELGLTAKKAGRTVAGIESMIPIIVTTYGPQGSRISGKSLPNPIDIKPVAHVKSLDPTGAGDAYRAGFLYGYVRGWELASCAKLGSVTAAYAVETAGTQEFRFNLPAVNQRFYQAYNEKLNI